MFERALSKALIALNEELERRGIGKLAPADLLSWLADSSAETIVAAACVPKGSAQELQPALHCVHTYLGAEAAKPPVRLRRVWDAAGWNEKQRNGAIDSVLNTRSSPGDIYFLPGPPELKSLGLVVRLRNFYAIARD
ncbi:MAG: hypothetical protein LC776_00970, partial [Acidobacteria bacterium]|nr:hypothetical protein [Acidobacteriota bacterium]